MSDFLLGQGGPEEYIDKLDREAAKYNGFNLIVGEKGQYYWYSNRGDGVRSLSAGIYGLMEDAATAEIARSQVWQWLEHGAELTSGEKVTPELVQRFETEELERIRGEIGDDEWFEKEGRPKESRKLFEQVALADDFPEFLTLPAYDFLLEHIERAGSVT